MESLTGIWCSEALDSLTLEKDEQFISRIKWALQAYEHEKSMEAHAMVVSTLAACIQTHNESVSTALWILESLADERNGIGKSPAPLADVIGITLLMMKSAHPLPSTYMQRLATVIHKITI